jgi:hypothetical protein
MYSFSSSTKLLCWLNKNSALFSIRSYSFEYLWNLTNKKHTKISSADQGIG